MTKYNIHPRGGMWCVGAAGKPVTWFHNKHEAEAWVDAQDAQGGRDDVVWGLVAIRDAVYILVLTVLAVFFFSIFIWNELANGIDTLPPLPPPETQQHGLDLPHTPHPVVASRDTSHGPSRRTPVCKTLVSTSERPGPGRHHRALPEWISLVPRGSGWGPRKHKG